MFFIFVAPISELEVAGMVVEAEVVTGMVVVAEVVAGMVVVAEVVAGMVVVAEVVAGMVVVAEIVVALDVLLARVVVTGVEDTISLATSPLNRIKLVCPCKMIFRLVQSIFLLQ